MRTYFTKRHEKGLDEKTLEVSLPIRLRESILRTLEKFSVIDDNWGTNFTFNDATETLKTFYGLDSLRAYKGSRSLLPSDFKEVIRTGWPPHVFDCIEAWFDHADQSRSRSCEKELNDVFDIHRSPWRFVNSSLMLVDSQYLHNEVVAKTLSLMRDQATTGALEEFSTACNCLQERRCKDAVVAAHKSVESMMKTVLGKPTGRFGELIADLVKRNVVPAYYEEFASHFEKILLAAGKERNLPGRGHGQGHTPVEVPFPLAEFAVHLAAVVNLFLLKRWIEGRSKTQQGN